MDQRILIGIPIAIIIVFIAVFLLYQAQEAQPKEQDYEPEFDELDLLEEDMVPVEQGSILQECGTQETQHKKDLCWSLEAALDLDPEKCLNIAERPTRINCLRGIARDYFKPDIVAEINECDKRFPTDNDGYYNCIAPLEPTIKNDKLAICNKYFASDEMQKYRCHAEIARELYDEAICGAIPEGPYRDNCHFILDLEMGTIA